jgi:hypothetical protein
MADRATAQGLGGQLGTTADSQYGTIAVNRQGGVITQDQIIEWAVQGHMYHAQIGDGATAVNFAETSYDEDQPQFSITVPSGRTVIPCSMVVEMQDQAGTDTHIVWSTTTNNIGAGTSTSATITNMRSDAPFSAGSTAQSLYTANATAATGLKEVIRWVNAFADVNTFVLARYEWNIRTAGAVPVLVGPATLQLHAVATGTAPVGFMEMTFIDLASADVVAT